MFLWFLCLEIQSPSGDVECWKVGGSAALMDKACFFFWRPRRCFRLRCFREAEKLRGDAGPHRKWKSPTYLGHQLEANTCFSQYGTAKKREFLSRRGQAPLKKTRCAKMISTTSPDLGEAEDPEQEDLAARWSRILLNDFPSIVKSARAGMIRQTCKLLVLKTTLVGKCLAFALLIS